MEGEVREKPVNVMRAFVGSGENQCEEVIEGVEVILFFFFGGSPANWMLEQTHNVNAPAAVDLPTGSEPRETERWDDEAEQSE